MLKHDVFSLVYRDGKNPLQYGNRGDTLSVISRSGHVLIVEDKNGNRFPVNENNVVI